MIALAKDLVILKWSQDRDGRSCCVGATVRRHGARVWRRDARRRARWRVTVGDRGLPERSDQRGRRRRKRRGNQDRKSVV